MEVLLEALDLATWVPLRLIPEWIRDEIRTRHLGREEPAWTAYDPARLVDLAEREGSPLADSFRRCTRAWTDDYGTTYFVDPRRANLPGSEWQFVRTIQFPWDEDEALTIDLLDGDRIGSVTFHEGWFEH